MRTVITCGCFDCLHEGHKSFLEKSKALGDWLIVLLNTDDYCRRIKGEGRPIYDWLLRGDALMNLGCVDDVLQLDEDNPCKWLMSELREENDYIFTKGIEYKDRIFPERVTCKELDVDLVFVDSGSPVHSSYFNLLQ